MVDKIEDKTAEVTKKGLDKVVDVLEELKDEEKASGKDTDTSFRNLTDSLNKLNEIEEKNDKTNDQIKVLQGRRNEMMAEAAGVSIEEATRRNTHNDEMAALTKEIEDKTAVAGKDSKEVKKLQGIKDKKDSVEKKRQFIENNVNFKNLGEGIMKISESIGGKVKATGSMLLKGIGVIALFAFLQSDTFRAVVSSIVDFVTDFVGLFTGEVDTLDFIGDHFGKIALVFLLMLPKIIAIGKFIVGIPAILSGISAGFAAISAGLGAFLAPLGALLIPLAIPILIVAAIAAVAYGLVKLFRSFEENFSAANEEFGFFGGVAVSVMDALRDIFVGVLEFFDFITFGIFDFGFIEYMKNLDVFAGLRTVIEFVGNFFSGFADIISSAIGSLVPDWVKKWIPGTDASDTRKKEVVNNNFEQASKQMSGGEDDPAKYIARKENENMQMRRKEEMMSEKREVTIINNNNSVVKGGDSYSEVSGGDINVHDSANDPYTNMT
jgi:hypothetical protein